MKQYAWLLALATIFLISCQSQSAPSTSTPFFGGTSGLVINFEPNSPPSEVIDGGRFPFSIIVKLENNGEADILPGKAEVRITGIYPPDFGQNGNELKKTNTEPILGIKKDSEGNKIAGGLSQVSFENLNYNQQLQGNLQLPIRAEVCYNYETRMSSTYCMKKDLLSTAASACKVNEPKPTYNSGAPVQVTSFTESVAGSNTVLFNFKVSLKGNGNVYKGGTTCNPNLVNQNKVYVIVDSGLVSGLKCQGIQEKDSDKSGFLRLSNGEATFTCTQQIAGSDAVKELSLKLNYDYLETKSATVLVKHVSNI